MKHVSAVLGILLLAAGAVPAYASALIPGPNPDLADMLNHPDGYVTIPSDPVLISLPPDTIKAEVKLLNLSEPGSGSGGTLGGELHPYSPGNGAVAQLTIFGEDDLSVFSRWINIPISGEAHTALRVVGAPVQSFDTDMFQLQGEIFGDPDFDLLRITAGTDFGLPGPGHTTLTKQGGDFAVDSFFDITYRIEFTGAIGSLLEGMSGSITSISQFRLDIEADPAIPDPAGRFDGTASEGNSESAPIIDYQWDFGDNSFGTGPVVEHLYPDSGIYRVELTVVDTGNNAASTFVFIEAVPEPAGLGVMAARLVLRRKRH